MERDAQTPAKASPKRTKKEWQRLVNDFQDSGLSQSEYARRNGLSLSAFCYHLRLKRKPNTVSSQFVPVILPEADESKETDFRLRFLSGIELAVPSHFSEPGLLRLIKMLRSAGC